MKRLLLSAAIAAALAPNAYGQVFEIPSENTDEIVSIGQRIGGSSKAALTSAVSVITAEDIEARNQIYVTDILRSLPGVSVNNSGPSTNLSQIRVRGNEANQVLVIIDGVKVNNPFSGEFDFGGLQAGNIARVELLRGEQSALWGADAIGGVINIVTKTGQVAEQYNASIEAGSFNTVHGQISTTFPVGGAALSLNAEGFSSDNFDISDSDGEEDSSKSQSYSIGLNDLDIGPIKFGAKASLINLDTRFEALVNSRLQDTLDDQSDRSIESYRLNAAFNTFGIDHLITATSNRERTSTILTQVGFNFVTLLEVIETDPISGENLTNSSNTVGQTQNINWTAKKNHGAHSLTLLAEAEFLEFSRSAVNSSNVESQADDDLDSQSIAADYSYVTDKLSLNGSARQDFNSLFEDTFTWKAGFGYNLDQFGLGRVRGSLGTGIKNPTLTEVFGVFSPLFAGNPNLVAEKSFGYNIGYTHNFWDEAITVSVDYFNSELENEIFTEFNSAPVPSRANNRANDSTREGVEVELIADISDKLSFRGAATFLESEEDGEREVRRPEFIGSASATYSPIDSLRFTATVDHTGSQEDSDFSTFPSMRVTLDEFTLVGLNAAYDISDNLTISLRGDNLLDENYQQVLDFSSQGRGVYGGLSAKF